MKRWRRNAAVLVITASFVACSGQQRDHAFDVSVSTGQLRTANPTLAPPSTAPSTPSTTASASGTTQPASPPSTPATSLPLPGAIASLTVAPAHPDGYDRDLFGSGWSDTDRDCQDTRAEALIAESHVPVTYTTASACTVSTGEWVDPWSGTVNTVARALDVDHTVPLANAWRSGAWAWTPEQRIAYANDLSDTEHLIGIPLGENRSKGDDGPEAWKPPNPSAWCRYAQIWTAIKARWGLTATAAEWSTLLDMANTC